MPDDKMIEKVTQLRIMTLAVGCGGKRVRRCLMIAIGMLAIVCGCQRGRTIPNRDTDGALWPMESGYVCVLMPPESRPYAEVVRMVFVAEAAKPAYEYWKEHKWPSQEDISAMVSEGWDVKQPSELSRYAWAAYLLKKAEKNIEGKERTRVEAFNDASRWHFREISKSGGHLVKKPLKKELRRTMREYFWPGWDPEVTMVFVAEAVKPAYEYWKEHKWPSKEDIPAMASEGWEDVAEPSDVTRYTWAAYLLKKAEKNIEGKERTRVEAFNDASRWHFREISKSGGHLVKKPLKKELRRTMREYFWPGWNVDTEASGYFFHTDGLKHSWMERPSELLEPSKDMRKCLVQWKGGQVHAFITSNEHRVVAPGLGLLALADCRLAEKSNKTDKSHEVGFYLANLMVPSKKLNWAKPLRDMKVTEE